jgi:uncharacterized SAM-binding protein YcdF (DUF218 family)
MKREISKIPDSAPKITIKLRDLLTELCFFSSPPTEAVDLIFVYGTPYFFNEVITCIINLLNKKISTKVLITGGIVLGEAKVQQKSEARLIYEKFSTKYFNPNTSIFLEENSQNTLENVKNGLSVLDFSHYERICFISPPHISMRGYLTLRKFLPKTDIFSLSYDIHYPRRQGIISKNTWYNFDMGIKRVWGKFLRIQQYGHRGDIDYNQKISSLVAEINHLIRENQS